MSRFFWLVVSLVLLVVPVSVMAQTAGRTDNSIIDMKPVQCIPTEEFFENMKNGNFVILVWEAAEKYTKIVFVDNDRTLYVVDSGPKFTCLVSGFEQYEGGEGINTAKLFAKKT